MAIHTKQRVISYDFDAPSATTEDGHTWTTDLLVCADGILGKRRASVIRPNLHLGIKSIARPLLTSKRDISRDTGDVVYRILIPGETPRDPDLASLVTEPANTSWCGPDAHLVRYPIRNGVLYNIVVCATSYNETTDEVWLVKGDNQELYKCFQ